jgi:hypothetical protein
VPSSALHAVPLALALLAAAPAPDPIAPDPQLTPGAVMTEDAATVCQPGYARSVRHTSGRLKSEVYRAYGIDPRGGHYEVDHLVSLELGGADVRENLWPQSYDTQPWNAAVKDRLENDLHARICAGILPLVQAQREIAADWIGAYRRYLGDPEDPPPARRGRRRGER